MEVLVKRTLQVVLALTLLGILVAAPNADAKKKPPIPFSICTTTANQAGRTYHMTTGTTCASGSDGVEVSADNVTIDLGGFELTGGGNHAGILVDLNVTGTRIKHGTITGFSQGIDAHNAANTIVDRISAIRNGVFGIFIGPGTVKNSIASKNNGTGIDVHGRTAAEGRGVIKGSLATNNTSDGMVLTQTVTGLIDRSTSSDNLNRGIFMAAQTAVVRRTNVTGNSSTGVELDDVTKGTADRVQAVANTGQGIASVGTGAATITRSTAIGNGNSSFEEGISVLNATGPVNVTKNTVEGSYGDGIKVDPSIVAKVDGNTANSNGWGDAVFGENYGINSSSGEGFNHASANDAADNQCVDDVLC
jgi:parallel beta-helix repeat protein